LAVDEMLQPAADLLHHLGAGLFVDEGLDLRLEIVACEGWRRSQTWDETGLVWTNPSPNMRRLSAALLYPGIGLLETTNLSVGRGTDTPFEVLGAPWIEPQPFAAMLNDLELPGVRAVPRRFTPNASKYAGELCGGVDLVITDFNRVEPVRIGITVAHALRKLYPDNWQTDRLSRLLVSRQVEEAIVSGAPPSEIKPLTEVGLDEFKRRRAAALIYR
ncbi:MAG: DUF1343 domain-containing protein, partial [Planctomycetales bacterium]|nr:DUF1343 domain-containing protein [Planctomycetales bacterium]